MATIKKKDEVNNKVRADIIRALEIHEWSAAELARKSGISQATISRIISGKIASPTFDDVVVLYEALGIPLPNAVTARTSRYTQQELVAMAARSISYPTLTPNNDDIISAEKSVQALFIAGAVIAQ